MPMSLRVALLVATGVVLVLVTASGGQVASAQQASVQASTMGEWSPPMLWPVAGIHAAVLPTGKVLHYSYPHSGLGSEAWLWDPQTGTLVPAPINRNVFCGGHSFLPDGKLLVTGGTDPLSPQGPPPFGIKDLHTFDPLTESWTYVGDMQVGRWYPTNVTLPDGRILILSGLDEQGQLTDLVEEAVLKEFDRLTERGGVLGAMERQYQRGAIQDDSLKYEQDKHSGVLPLIGVNTFLPRDATEASHGPSTKLTRAAKEEKELCIQRLEDYKERHGDDAIGALCRLKEAALNGDNIFAELMKAAECCTLGQITHALYEVGGEYRRNI